MVDVHLSGPWRLLEHTVCSMIHVHVCIPLQFDTIAPLCASVTSGKYDTIIGLHCSFYLFFPSLTPLLPHSCMFQTEIGWELWDFLEVAVGRCEERKPAKTWRCVNESQGKRAFFPHNFKYYTSITSQDTN